MTEPSTPGPLAGLRVLELGTMYAAPTCGRMLRDFGADVVKVERPQGDVVAWVDLDLDLTLHGDEVDLEDEAVFHHHAETMGYPPEVVQGAWEGISELAPRYTTEEWPFDSWMEGCLERARAHATEAGGS